MQYEETGYLPEAMVNFLARLGWAHGDAEYSRAASSSLVRPRAISPAPSRFNADKLRWVNHEHLKRLSEDELGTRLVIRILARAGLDSTPGPRRAPWRC
jgi:glutamyl-tRNA synthetase